MISLLSNWLYIICCLRLLGKPSQCVLTVPCAYKPSANISLKIEKQGKKLSHKKWSLLHFSFLIRSFITPSSSLHSDDLLFPSYIHLKLNYNYIMFYVYLFTVERLDKKLVDVISLFEISFSQNNIKKSSWSSWMSSLTRIASF